MITCLRWNPLGTLFASGTSEGIIQVWRYHGERKASGLALGGSSGPPIVNKTSI